MAEGPILIVDDDALLRDVLGTALSLSGYQTTLASNGSEGLTAILANRPALVLLDLHMPVMDGETVLKELKEHGIQLPVVVMTAEDVEAETVAKRYGLAAFLKKPFPFARLLSAIHACGLDPRRRPKSHRAAA